MFISAVIFKLLIEMFIFNGYFLLCMKILETASSFSHEHKVKISSSLCWGIYDVMMHCKNEEVSAIIKKESAFWHKHNPSIAFYSHLLVYKIY